MTMMWKGGLCCAGFRRRKFRAVREYLTGFHFLGGLMSFENFIREWTRWVDRLPFWQKVRSYLTDTHRGNTQISPEREIKSPKPEVRSARRRIGRILSERLIRNQSPTFCGQRRAELFLGESCTKTATRKMNRSFHKSQPLRSADCNAVEVKSKVSVEVWWSNLFFIVVVKTAYPEFEVAELELWLTTHYSHFLAAKNKICSRQTHQFAWI